MPAPFRVALPQDDPHPTCSSRDRAGRVAHGESESPRSHVRDAPTQPAPPQLAAILDLTELRARARDDDALIRSLFADFVLRRERWTAELRDAVTREDFGELALLAHRLRGALNTLGARRAGAIASEVEARAAFVDLAADGHGSRRAVADAAEALANAILEVSNAMHEHLRERSTA